MIRMSNRWRKERYLEPERRDSSNPTTVGCGSRSRWFDWWSWWYGI